MLPHIRLHPARSGALLFAAFTLLPAAALAGPPLELEAEPSWTSADPQRVGGVALGDANRDGVLDLAVATYSGGYPEMPTQTHVFLGNGSGLEMNASWVSDETSFSTAVGWLVVDGTEPDLFTVNGGPGEEASLRYGGSADPMGVRAASDYRGGGRGSGLDYAFGDVNGDGIADLFIANQCYMPCPGAPNLGFVSEGGSLPNRANWSSDNVGQFSGIAMADLDRSHIQARTVTFTGDGARQTFWLAGAPIQRITRVLVDGADPGPLSYDYRGGYVQMAQAPADGAAVEVLYEVSTAPDLLIAARPGGIQVYPNDGSGIPKSPASVLGSESFQYKVLMFADLNLDGYLDLVAAGSRDAAIDVYMNDGGSLGTAPAWSSAEADFGGQDLAVADFNSDGYMDVVAVKFTDSTLGELWMNQEGVLESESSWQLPWGGKSIGAVGAGDLNSDAMPDLIIAHAGHNIFGYSNLADPMPPPIITSKSGPMGSDDVSGILAPPGQAFELVITGENFRAPISVYVGDQLMTDVVLDGNTITVQVPAMDDGTYSLTVVNPGLRADSDDDAIQVGEGGDVDLGDPDGDEPGAGGAGCGCRTAGGQGGMGALLALFGAALVLRRRRR